MIYTVLTIFSLISASYGRTHVTLTAGSKYTLKGPDGHNGVIWWRIFDDGGFVNPCSTSNRYSCNGKDLTIINATKSDNGYYYGTNYITSLDYTITVISPTTPSPHKTTTFSSSSTITTTKIKTTSNIEHVQKMASNSTLPATNEIPKSIIGIIVAAIVGLSIIISCIIYYACCYRKIEKGDPLLSFDI